jgi:hypothetical protein
MEPLEIRKGAWEAKRIRGGYEAAALYAMPASDWPSVPRVAIGSE